MSRADPIAEALALYDAEMRAISTFEAAEEARKWEKYRREVRRLMRREVVKAYFRRLTRMGVAIDPRGACPGLPSARERVVWADIRRLGAAGWGLPEWRNGFRR